MSRCQALATMASATLFLAACGVEFGAQGGAQLRDPHIVGTEHLAVSTKIGTPLNQQGWLVGAEVGARTEQRVGSRWLFGLRLGYGRSPDPFPWSLGWEAHLDLGTPLGNDGFAPYGSFYMGATVATPVWLSGRHEAEDLNASLWLLKRVVELVPYASTRVHRDGSGGAPAFTRVDLGAGLALRLRFVSDLF